MFVGEFLPAWAHKRIVPAGRRLAVDVAIALIATGLHDSAFFLSDREAWD